MSYDPPTFTITVRAPVEHRLPARRVHVFAELELTVGGVSTSTPRVVIEGPQGRLYARCHTGMVYDTDTDAWTGTVQRRHGTWYLADTGLAQAATKKIGGLRIMAERAFAAYGPAVSAPSRPAGHAISCRQPALRRCRW